MSSSIPWKPAIIGISPLFINSKINLSSILFIFAFVKSLEPVIGICQPNRGLPLKPISFKAIEIRAIDICSPVETIISNSSLFLLISKFSAKLTNLLVSPDIAEETTVT